MTQSSLTHPEYLFTVSPLFLSNHGTLLVKPVLCTLTSAGIHKLKMELLLKDLFSNNPDTLTDTERATFFQYFHGMPVGCSLFQKNPLIQDEQYLQKHSEFLQVTDSTIMNIEGKNRGTFWNCRSDLVSKSFICDYGGFVYLAPVDSKEELDFFGLPERSFKFSIQPFRKWGYDFYIVGSDSCPGTYINEMRTGTALDPRRCSAKRIEKLSKKLSVLNCEMLEKRCFGFNVEKNMFDSFEICCAWLIHPLSIFSKRRIENKDELLMTYDNREA